MIICVLLPFFAAGVEQKRNPMLADEFIALVDNSRKTRRIAAVSKQLAQVDVRQGMALRHAQTLVPELQALPLNPIHYREKLEGLVNTLRTFSDRIEIAYKGWGVEDEKIMLSVQAAASTLNPAVAFLDIGRLNPKSLYQMGQQLQTALQFAFPSARIGIASNRFTSWVAAQATQDGVLGLVNPGEEKWALTCHPVSMLPLDDKVLRRLWWLGIRTLGDFAALPSAAIRPQFGKSGQVAYQLAQGIDKTPIHRLARQLELSRSVAFDDAISDAQVVSLALKDLISELVRSLGTTGETARKVRLTLSLDHRGACEFEKPLRRRSSTNTQFYSALQQLFDNAKITAPISEITVTLMDIVPIAARQLELFPAMAVVEDRNAVLDDFVARYGHKFFTASVKDDKALLPQKQIEFKEVETA